jgi:hypothetical protein
VRRDRRALALFLVALFASGAFLGPAEASRARTLNLEQLAAHADRIFRGRCIQAQVAIDPTLGQTVTYVSFVPEHVVRGPSSLHGTLTIKLLGNRTSSAGPGDAIDGLPQFEAGEEVILFLYPDSAHGLTSPVGLGQGKFRVVPDKAGKPVAANMFGNDSLFDGLSSRAQKKLGGSVERYRGAHGIPADALLDMAKALAP